MTGKPLGPNEPWAGALNEMRGAIVELDAMFEKFGDDWFDSLTPLSQRAVARLSNLSDKLRKL